ncbi:SprT family zinc-dependent metalloprotease [uncultured Nocardioides sp.]|uniref:SprT family zinc-dependent metalloprotease n=1 Tax=uncultured Nocardioides sp. TaxID=198441 RepID=UPI002617FC55|nr:SprT family zinc-dependent metalloprotease [uncultured Nocardioides sp.]
MDITAALSMGEQLLAEHGLTTWRVQVDRAKRRAGQCRYADQVITISAPLTRLHDEAEVRETLLHEVAHALAGPRAGHGPRWRAIATRIGSTGERCLSSDAPKVAGAWVGTCPAGHTTERHRRPTRVATCSRCSRTFSLDHVLTWTRDGAPAPMHPSYAAELEALQGARREAGPGARPGGARDERVAVGTRVRVLAPGRWHGRGGPVVKVGRTRYHVSVGRDVVLAVPMSAVAVDGGPGVPGTG